jgi:hypothetical protein
MSVAELRQKFEAKEVEQPKSTPEPVVEKGFVASKIMALQGAPPTEIKFTSEREGDFFSAVQQHTITLLHDGKDLSRVQDAVRAAHTDINAGSMINLLLSSFGDVVPLTEQSLQQASAGEELRVLFSTRTVASYKVHFTTSLSDANLDAVSFDFAFTIPQAGLYEAFRGACIDALSLEPAVNLTTTISVDGSSFIVNGSKSLEEFLTDFVSRTSPAPPHVIVSITAKGGKERACIIASLLGELESREAEFEFEFAHSDSHLLDSLRDAIRHELDLDNEKKQLSLNAIIDGSSFPLTEKVLVEVLFQHQAPKLRIEVEIITATATRQVSVFCRFASSSSDEEAGLTFRYSLVESSLLYALSCEIAGELEAEFDRSRLTFVSGEEMIVVASDTMLRELLLSGLQELHFVLHPIKGKDMMERVKAVTCTFEGEEVTFPFSYNLRNDGLLELFKAECRAETDLMPNDRILLTAVVDGARIPIERDGTLLELLGQDEDLAVIVEEVRPPPKAIIMQREVVCTMGGDTVRFMLSFTLQQDGLLEHLVAEVKDELDLMPSEDILLSLVLEGDEEGGPMDVNTDRVLRDIIVDTPRLVLSAKLKEKAQRQKARVASILWKTPSEEAQCELEYRDNESLLELLCQEIRSELELDGSISITFTDDLGGALDEAGLRRLAALGTTTTINVILPKSQRDALEEMPLNRNAELHALFYDWQDILGDTFDASDLRLVLQNVKQDGKPLPPGDAIFGKIAEFANSGRSRRTESDLLPLIGTMMAHYPDTDVSTLCHLCRDVISFMVDVSPQSRHRRAVSQVFRTLSVNDAVSLPQLVGLLNKSGIDEAITSTVVDGFGEKLSLRDFRAIIEQLFGESVQDVADLITTAEEALPSTSGRGEKEVHVLRRQRLISELKHALDGIACQDLNQLAVEPLKFCIAALISPQTIAEESRAATTWFASKVQSEVACYNFYTELTNFKSSSMDEATLHEVCALLVSHELAPSYLLPTSAVASAVAAWATAAAQLVCLNRRFMFPYVLAGGQSPRVARKPEGPKGVSAPRHLRKLYEENPNNSLVAANSPNNNSDRFEPRLSHLCNDLQITEGQNSISYRQYTTRQLADAPAPPQ